MILRIDTKFEHNYKIIIRNGEPTQEGACIKKELDDWSIFNGTLNSHPLMRGAVRWNLDSHV